MKQIQSLFSKVLGFLKLVYEKIVNILKNLWIYIGLMLILVVAFSLMQISKKNVPQTVYATELSVNDQVAEIKSSIQTMDKNLNEINAKEATLDESLTKIDQELCTIGKFINANSKKKVALPANCK